MNFEPVVLEQIFRSPISKVWKAITEKDQMRKWYFAQMKDFVPEVGFSTEFDVECDGEVYRHCWKVTEVVPETRIAYDWNYKGIPGLSTATWELSEIPEGTKLTLTHTGGETFPQDNPLFSRESGVAGWKYLIQENLVAHMEQG